MSIETKKYMIELVRTRLEKTSIVMEFPEIIHDCIDEEPLVEACHEALKAAEWEAMTPHEIDSFHEEVVAERHDEIYFFKSDEFIGDTIDVTWDHIEGFLHPQELEVLYEDDDEWDEDEEWPEADLPEEVDDDWDDDIVWL